MKMAVKVEVWGDLACFTRPEMKVERVSYDVMTPSAARGLLESIYWHPGMVWRIDRIYVLNPIRFTNIRRNEVKSKISAQNVRAVMNGSDKPLYISTSEDIQQRAATMLRDVRYVIQAHFDLTDRAAPGDNPGKFASIINRRLEKGMCYSAPYLGTRECSAYFRPCTREQIDTAYPDEVRDLGYMLYDLDYSDPENIQPMFFRAKLVNGVLDLADCEVVR